MFSHPGQTIQQNQIPKVKDLCQALGFDNTYGRTEQVLKDTTHSWRKQYKTRDGISGKDLTEWRSVKTHNDLWRMSKDYLETGGYGMIHWPSKGNSSPRSVPEYPRDELRILDLLIQLFWQENRNQAHNAKFPDRGRRLLESVESDRSSATLPNPSTSGYPHLPVPPYTVEPQSSFSTTNDRWIPVGTLWNPAVEKLLLDKPTQNSVSVRILSINEADDPSPQLLRHTTTLNGSTTRKRSRAEDLEDIFEYHGSDSDVWRQGHNKPSKIVVLKANPQTRDKDETRKEPPRRARVANMQVAPAKTLITPTKLRPQPDKATSQSKSPSAQASRPKSSPESRESKRKDVDGDSEDGEYTPRKRSKRHKATSHNHIDTSIVAKSKPTRRAPSPVRESEERPIVRSVEHRGARLPTTSKAKSKPPTEAPNIGQKRAETISVEKIASSDYLLDEGVEYIGTLERSPASATRRVGEHAEKSPLSAPGNAEVTPNIKTEQNVSHTDSASRQATIERAAALRIAVREAKSPVPASSTKPAGPVINARDRPPTGSKSMHTTDGQNNSPNGIPKNTNNRPESQPPQCVQEQGNEAQHVHHALPTHDLPKQTNPARHIPSSAPSTNERHETLSKTPPQKQASPTQHRPALKPQISYWVFAMPNGRLTLLQWPDGSFVGKTIDTLFEEVASLAGKQDIKSIFFRLTASQKDAVCVVKRNDVGAFEVMKKKFSRLINEDLKMGNTDFEIELDPGHVEPQGQMETREDDIDPRFSLG